MQLESRAVQRYGEWSIELLARSGTALAQFAVELLRNPKRAPSRILHDCHLLATVLFANIDKSQERSILARR